MLEEYVEEEIDQNSFLIKQRKRLKRRAKYSQWALGILNCYDFMFGEEDKYDKYHL